ncbi:MAG: tRNA 2-thiouridine(34) synthase MnmA [Oscillospiraceae bacterium]|nr:tRNA 2-thiouridine(34) synthase MnmA [Oscillospiraceae bacterium]
MKIVVGLSGGVDSAVAAWLLREMGHEVVGVTLRTWEDGGSRCCAIDDARETARHMGIPYHVINCACAFRKAVERPFVDEYLCGRTPNPCVVCNREVKWEWLLYAARLLCADAVSTGHYASVVRLESGRWTLRRATHKDQSYMLWRLSQEQLSRTILPLGDLDKEEVRHIAKRAGLPVADKADSQEICFVAQKQYASYVERHAPPHALRGGNFVDREGRILGRHQGIVRYTVGQRRGLGLALGRPVYVTDIRTATNEVVIGEEADLYRSEIQCTDLNWMSVPDAVSGERTWAAVQIRSHHKGEPARIVCDPDMLRIRFDQPVRAPTPGQSAVCYDGENRIICGGVIERGES